MDWVLAFNLIPFSTVCCPFLINAEMFWPEFVLTGELCLVLRFRVGRKVVVSLTIPGQTHRDTAVFRVTQSDRANAVALSLPKKHEAQPEKRRGKRQSTSGHSLCRRNQDHIRYDMVTTHRLIIHTFHVTNV